MQRTVLSAEALARALAVRDLTDPAQGMHAVQLVACAAVDALRAAWGCEIAVGRSSPIVSVADNYDRLRYPPGGAARDARYTRYVSDTHLLRTQTSAMIPPLLRRLAPGPPRDLLLACSGVVYRRDAIDRLHAAEPHQLDLWRVRAGPPLGTEDLEGMIRAVAAAALPGAEVRAVPASHPYTVGGRQIDVRAGAGWVEIGECGLAHPAVLADAGLSGCWTGLAMGLRLLRSTDPRIAPQMADLAPWRPVSRHPPVRRDLSVAVAEDAAAEDLGDRVREALGDRAADVEAIEVVSETPGAALPEAARRRLGVLPGQKNVLLRVVLRALGRTLTAGEANRLRDDVYAAVHEGTAHQWAARR